MTSKIVPQLSEVSVPKKSFDFANLKEIKGEIFSIKALGCLLLNMHCNC
jgi:hypothetical protein